MAVNSKNKTVNPNSAFNTQTILDWLKTHRVIILVFLIHSIAWLAIDQFITPHPDFIDHWTQSRILSLSYFEHPPMVALFIRGLTTVFGISEIGLEIAALLVNLFIIGFAYAISRYLFGHLAGIFTLIGLELTPFFMVKSASIQTEQPLSIFWLATVLCFLVYLKTDKSRWILLSGVFAGCGALSKYTMILFYIGIFVYFTLIASRRKEWLNPWQYLGGMVALLVFSPVILWNYQHEWISFLFQLGKGSGAAEGDFGVMTGLFLLGTLFVYSFVLLVWGFWRMVKRFRLGSFTHHGKLVDSSDLFLVVLTITPLVFFSIMLLTGDYADPQWAILAMLTFFIWLGHESAKRWEEGKRKTVTAVYTAALILNLVLIGLAGAHIGSPLFYKPFSRNPAYPIVAWDQTGREMTRFLEENQIPLPEFIVSNHYPLGSQFSLQLASHPLTYAAGRILRNLWSDPNNMTRANTLFVCESEDVSKYDCGVLEERSAKVLGFKIEKVGSISHPVWNNERIIHIYRIKYKSNTLLSEEEKDQRLKF